MNRFLYFLPGSPGCNNDMLQTRGLLPRFTAAHGVMEYSVTQWNEGPAGFGCAVALGCEPARYSPETQTWMDAGAFWLGVDLHCRPAPGDLEREVGIAGHEARLLDGALWRVPLLRRLNPETMEHESALPKSFQAVKSANGRFEFKKEVMPKFKLLDALAEEVWQAFLARVDWPEEVLFATAVKLLCENYRVNVEEAGLLGILDNATALAVLQLSFDMPGIAAAVEELAKDGLHFAEVRDDG